MAMTRESLLGYLEDRQGIDPAELADDGTIFSSGLLDSFALVDVIVFIEETAEVKIAADEVSLENLDSVDRILAFVARKTTAEGGP